MRICQNALKQRDSVFIKVVFLSACVESADEKNKYLNIQMQSISSMFQTKEKELLNIIASQQEGQSQLHSEVESIRKSSLMSNYQSQQDKHLKEQEIARL